MRFLLLLVPLALASPASPDLDDRMANGVAQWLDRGVGTADFSTGTAGFDREWLFGAAQMAALGFAQHAATHPESRAADIARMDRALDVLLSKEGRAFDAAIWGEDPLDALAGTRGHVAWLGYTNLALSARRALAPGSRFDAENDAITAALVRRWAADPRGLPETYPGERYPVDTAAGVASVGLYDRVTGADHSAALARWRDAVHARWLDGGLLVQAVRADGSPRDAPRGSGTFLAAWFLSWWDPAFSRELYEGGRAALYEELAGHGAMREYPPGHPDRVDVDSGPIVGGLGVSATGFAIGAARANGDLATAAALTRTAELFGGPTDIDGARHWQSGATLGGAPLADAILFAMMGTPPGRAGSG